MNITCPSCNSVLDVDSSIGGSTITCPVCSGRFEVPQAGQGITVVSRGDGGAGQSGGSDIAGKFAEVMGVTKPKGFKWKEFFSEVFKKHTKKEIESYFMVGTAETTPDIFGVSTEWPKPWMFARCLLGCILLYLPIYLIVKCFGRSLSSTVTDLIIIGSFAVPISFALLFFELNVRRNVSLYEFVRFLFFGGVISIYLLLPFSPLSEFLSNILPPGWQDTRAGLVEETTKLVSLLFLARGRNYRYIHNGLLLGAAVGAGFGMFESAGYAFGALTAQNGSFALMETTIFRRAVFAPVGHVAYSSIWAGALWRVKGDRPFSFSMLYDWRFLKFFILGVLLHVFWNSPLLIKQFGAYSGYVKMAIVGIIAWFVIFSLVQEGLEQIRKEQRDILSN